MRRRRHAASAASPPSIEAQVCGSGTGGVVTGSGESGRSGGTEAVVIVGTEPEDGPYGGPASPAPQ